MKIRITKNDNEEELYDMFMNVLSDKFDVINISKEYKNRNGNEKRIYVDINQK